MDLIPTRRFGFASFLLLCASPLRLTPSLRTSYFPFASFFHLPFASHLQRILQPAPNDCTTHSHLTRFPCTSPPPTTPATPQLCHFVHRTSYLVLLFPPCFPAPKSSPTTKPLIYLGQVWIMTECQKIVLANFGDMVYKGSEGTQGGSREQQTTKTRYV